MWTLYGYRTNPNYEGNRFFNLSSIYNVQIKKETFELPEDFSYENKAIRNFGRHISEETSTFKIKIYEKWKADYIKTYQWSPDQKFEKLKDGTVEMTFTSNQYYPVLDWVLSHGQFVKPLEPKKLVEDWKNNVKKMMERMGE